MPSANIDRAIKKGTGELEGVHYEEGVLEGYGPGGVAIYIEFVTDNRNRTVAEIRHHITKHGGNLAESGAVAWMFEKKGLVTVPSEGVDEDQLLLQVVEAGAEDMTNEGEFFEIICQVDQLEDVKAALDASGIEYESARLHMVPKNTLQVEGKNAEHLLKLMDLIEEHDDVQSVYANFDIDASVMEQMES
jgi:YebC/PmpR family DNA-binding regulatory protein